MAKKRPLYYDWIGPVIKNQTAARQPQVRGKQPSSFPIQKPGREISLKNILKGYDNTCICEGEGIIIDNKGSFSDGFNEGFDI